MKVEELPIESIKPYEKNPRKNDGAVNGVAESIKQFGFQQPIVIDKTGVIVAGHTRYKAALKLGLKTVPCVRAEKLSPKQVKAYRILDNKLNELATWNFEMLGEELADVDFNFEPFEVVLPTISLSDFFDESQSNGQGVVVAAGNGEGTQTVGNGEQTGGTPVAVYSGGGSSIPAPQNGEAVFRLLIDFEDEDERDELFERLVSEGFDVRKI